MLEVAVIVFIFLAGYVVGLSQKGIHIHHVTEQPRDPKQGFNSTTEDLLPDDIRKSLENSKGYLKY